ncbi:Hansenula MRAKII killer toxin-resistant protein 1 [Actinoplanes sp. NPDC051513]|uniref:Hansenula MRAKII killer toxin-resistant protein 1 n=1 Tax=Actinoplanes sp. NPDC051513 TaxID=3363908 RepID=UPI0037A21A12
MADKGWTARVATAAGVAAGTGAAQLGLGYGLGVIVWPVTVTQDRSEWLGSLGWATWITASATVFGAVIASRLGGAQAPRLTWPWRVAFAASAGVGALVAVALIALPARSAVRLDAHSPQMIAASYALLGVVLGVIVAYWAVWSRPVAANLIATAAWLWALAITAIIVELTLNRDSATYLTSWQFAEPTTVARYGVISWPSALLTLSAAFLIGVIAVIPAVRRGDLGLGAATSGAVGPLLVAVSFLALSPRLTGTPAAIESAYLIAPYAVLAGLAGSALAVTAGKSMATRASTTVSEPGGEPAAHDQDAADPDAADEPERPATGTAAVPAPTPRPAEPAASPRPRPTATPAPAPRPAPTPSSPPKPDPKPANSSARTPNALTDPPKAPQPITAPPKAPDPVAGHPGAQPAAADPEIAEAARAGRPRAKKAAKPAEPADPKSTVTPPPATPTVAQINPKPTS